MTNTLERRILPRRTPAQIERELRDAQREAMRFPQTSRMHRIHHTRVQALALELALSTGTLSLGAI